MISQDEREAFGEVGPYDGTPMDPASTPPEPMPAMPGFPFLHSGCVAARPSDAGGTLREVGSPVIA